VHTRKYVHGLSVLTIRIGPSDRIQPARVAVSIVEEVPAQPELI
jgi:hypothetical protein